MVVTPSRTTSSSITNTRASSWPAIRILARSSASLILIEFIYQLQQWGVAGFQQPPGQLLVIQRRIKLRQHANPHPILRLRVDRARHGATGLAEVFMQFVTDFYDAHNVRMCALAIPFYKHSNGAERKGRIDS